MTEDFQCDSCPKTALYVVIIQDLIKEKDNIKDPAKFLCMEHTVKRTTAVLAVPGRYTILIEPTGAKQRATRTVKKRGTRVENDEDVAAEVNKWQ